ncbi:MAG: SPASM domain-containing protein [Bacteroidia bacterium]|nr:SPASM domain-containing protein [Bacteroidia bacterium]MCX7652486.1 SPASM domain-containing protein [Bacteroidia bacterium]MDW8416691.1 radical SAM/SPASM domain-containing protein [Bacteroidia bacterium]
MRWNWLIGGALAGLRMLTVRRALNAALVGGSYLAARYRLRWSPPKYPLFLGVEPTTACNLRCPQCISGLRAFTRPTGRLEVSLLEKLMDELHPHLWGVLFYFQGEPLLHPEIGRLIFTVSRYRLLSSISTNGHFLSEEKCYELIAAGLTHLRISVDGMSPETYSKYRVEGDLATVQAGINRLIQMRRAMRSRYPLVELQFIAFRHNTHEIADFRQWGRQIGADLVRVKTAQILHLTQEAYNTWIPENGGRYIQAGDGTIQLREKVPNRCWRLWRAAEVTWDGRVLPCCFDKDAEYSFGALREGDFTTIWHGPQAEAFRKRVFQIRESIDICRNCSEGTRTWL